MPAMQGYFFDFHVDTKPHDGTLRTVNVNVMLSPRDAYEGGTLQVLHALLHIKVCVVKYRSAHFTTHRLALST